MIDRLKKILSHDSGPFWQFVKYGAIGVMATLVHTGVFYVLASTCFCCLTSDDVAVRYLGLPAAVFSGDEAWYVSRGMLASYATAVGFFLANVFCWLMNRWFVFRPGKFRWYVEFGMFFGTFTYVPMLGAGGAYLSFVTGNISNLKLPCALDALERANVKPTSEEGEVISTISIAVSSIVTTIIIIMGVILIVPLTPILQEPTLAPAFDQILPALFGGLAVVFIFKNPKLAAAPIILMLILFIFVPALNSSTVGIMVPVGVIFTLIIARIMYKKGWI